MKKVLMIIAVCAGSFHLVHAETEDTRTELAVALIDAMEAEKLLRENIASMKETFVEQMSMMARATPEVDMSEAQTKILAIIEESMNWESVKDDFVDLYRSLFDEATLKGLLEFYRSDIGKEFVRKMPELTRRSQEISAQRMQDVMPKMMQVMQEIQPPRAPARPVMPVE